MPVDKSKIDKSKILGIVATKEPAEDKADLSSVISEFDAFFENAKSNGIQPAFQYNGIDAYLYSNGLYISIIEAEKIWQLGLFKEMLHNLDIERLVFTTKHTPGKETVYLLYKVPSKTVRIKTEDFPLDKVNRTVWNLLEDSIKRNSDGQIELFPISVEKHGAKTPVVVQYAISFDDLEQNHPEITFTKKLTPYEKRIYVAAGSLWSVKQQQPFSYSELYAAAGYTGRLGGNDTDKLSAAITKMNGAKIYVDNTEESNAYNYQRFRYDGSLLPMERISKIENDKPTEAIIHLFREPPLISYARAHKQITTISIKILQSPLSKTDANILLEDYFIERITTAKNERKKLEKKCCQTDEERDEKARALEKGTRILLKTVYENAKITTAKQRERAPQKIIRLLDHYKKEHFFEDYSIDEVAITIYF